MDILKYESEIWASADVLIAAGKKQSEFPDNMMPFFALRLVESRLLRRKAEIIKENSLDPEKDIEIIADLIKDENCGYNDYVIRKGIKLIDIVKNDKSFNADFKLYLEAFDSETRHLLGIDVDNKDENYLNLTNIANQLKGKGILLDFTTAWANIDLEPFNNSEITTLEEHIKRKWADLQADTAGEQYTPDDIISLIAEIVESKTELNSTEPLSIYDPTCGGGNLLFGVEDRLSKTSKRVITTHGMDNNSTLYALSKIESRFRTDSDIQYGNTLTSTYFGDRRFDVIVANPPYGLTWKPFKKDIESDKTGRFHAFPSIGDSQMLFDQHIAHYMNENSGLAIIVNNGSPFFSGDAGGGESEIRKYFLDNDWVEAIIQMPASEFFNTGILTYLWVLNRNKSIERKDKVILINGADLWTPLKKSKGDKRREMNIEQRAQIVDALTSFKDSDIAKVLPKWFCYYNKYAIQLFKVDNDGKAYCDFDDNQKPINKKTPIRLVTGCTYNGAKISDFLDLDNKEKIYTYSKDEIERICSNDGLYVFSKLPSEYIEDDSHDIQIADCDYSFNEEKASLTCRTIKETDEISKSLGCGKITYKISFRKAKIDKKTNDVKVPAHYEVSFFLESDTQNDYEIIPYNPIVAENEKAIAEFMDKYVSRPWNFVRNTIGTEINFNKIFYRPEELRSVEDILADINALDTELYDLEKDFML